MPLFKNLDVVTLKREFKHCDGVVRHELCGDGADREQGKFLETASNVLPGLRHAELVAPALRLYRYDELLSVAVHSDVNLVDFDLPYSLHEGLKGPVSSAFTHFAIAAFSGASWL